MSDQLSSRVEMITERRWYCQWCGATYKWSQDDPAVMACGNSNHYLVVASVRYPVEIPEPDPLIKLMVSATAIEGDTG